MPGTRTSESEARVARIDVRRARGSDWLSVLFVDGRVLGVPLAHFPTLAKANPAARKKWRLVGRGEGVHWPDLDLDLSAEGLLLGRPEMTRSSLPHLPISTLLSLALEGNRGVSPSEISRLLRNTLTRHQVRSVIEQLERNLAPSSIKKPA